MGAKMLTHTASYYRSRNRYAIDTTYPARSTRRVAHVPDVA